MNNMRQSRLHLAQEGSLIRSLLYTGENGDDDDDDDIDDKDEMKMIMIIKILGFYVTSPNSKIQNQEAYRIFTS